MHDKELDSLHGKADVIPPKRQSFNQNMQEYEKNTITLALSMINTYDFKLLGLHYVLEALLHPDYLVLFIFNFMLYKVDWWVKQSEKKCSKHKTVLLLFSWSCILSLTYKYLFTWIFNKFWFFSNSSSFPLYRLWLYQVQDKIFIVYSMERVISLNGKTHLDIFFFQFWKHWFFSLGIQITNMQTPVTCTI